MARILRLENQVQNYDWGSKSAIPTLLSLPNFEEQPWAEFWMGAHPKSPSRVTDDGEEQSLDRVIEERGEEVLGERVYREFGAELPFLFKLLSAARPLSLQAHPNSSQAVSGFEDENARGIALDAPHRNYRDPRPKPELLVALTSFNALKGFRQPDDIVRLLDEHDLQTLKPLRDRLAARPDPHGLEEFVSALLELENCNSAINEASARNVPWVEALNAHYPDEPAALCPIFLEVITLAPGEGIYLGPRELHAYLRGTALEIMGNSDNVLRAGLTTKHVDLPSLLAVLDFESRPQGILHATRDGVERRWETPAREFELSHIEMRATSPPLLKTSWGPRILLVVDGTLEIADREGDETVCLTRGDSALLCDGVREWEIRGQGSAYLAGVPQS